jgi:hypothetical protein
MKIHHTRLHMLDVGSQTQLRFPIPVHSAIIEEEREKQIDFSIYSCQVMPGHD